MSLRSLLGIVLLFLELSGCGQSAVKQGNAPGADGASDDAARLFEQGQWAAKRGDTVRAEQYLAMALERGFDERRMLPLMLQVCLSGSRLRSALNYSEHYLRKHPSDQSLRYLVATIHTSLGQREEARVDLRLLLYRDPTYEQAHYLLGILESGVNQAQASVHLRKYLEVAPHGEHAEEVHSRITDLAVRGAVDTEAKTESEASTTPQEIPTTTHEASPTSPAWFQNSQGFGDSHASTREPL